MKKVAFLCTHNACRSQIAEALARRLGAFEPYSAGTELKAEIDADALRLMKDLYGIDMTATQYPKLVATLPRVDYLVTMGCGVVCPSLPYECAREDWALEDPTGKPDAEFIATIREIEEKVRALAERIRYGAE